MDQTQWTLIVRQHTPLVWQTSARLLHNQADAHDCFQETFVSALKFARTQTVKNWPGLLQRLATARALDHLRKRQTAAKRQSPMIDLASSPSDSPTPHAAAESAELAHHLRIAIAQLPTRQSEIYCLRHLSGLSYEQIAAQLSISTSAVGVNLHRATQRLRQLLAPLKIEPQTQRSPS